MHRLLPLLALPLLAAPVLAQGNCSDGTTGVIVSAEVVAVQADSVTVCLALEGNPAETIGGVGFAFYYSAGHTDAWDPEAIPPTSPYNQPPYETQFLRCTADPYCNNWFWVGILGEPPFLIFSSEPVVFFCPRFALEGSPDDLAVDIRDLSATQGDGSPAAVCPPEDQGGYGVVVAAEPGAPASGVVLHAPRPNPARIGTAILFEVAAPTPVRLTIHDALGREVAWLVDGPVAAGAHEVPLAAGTLPAGVYLVRMETPEGVRVQRLALVR